MRLTRRNLIGASAALPLAGGLDRLAAAPLAASVLVYNPALPQAALLAGEPGAVPLSGDRIRFAVDLFARRPATVRVLGRASDAVLLGEVAREAGYRLLREHASGGLTDAVFVR